MIAACPTCSAKYRVDEAQLTADGVRLRCTKCQAIFPVRAPQPASAAVPAAAPHPQRPVDRTRLVLIADSEAEMGKQTANALSRWGLETVLVHDGVEAMVTTQRMLPRMVILDAALPKMHGFQVCEVIKRNESLRGTTVVLIGAIHDQDRYQRKPEEIYGADETVERPDLPGALVPILRKLGLAPTDQSAAPVSVAPQPAPVAPQPPQAAVPSPTPPAAAGGDPLAAERDKAHRLARIIVSDIILYNQEKFQSAVASGNVAELMDGDLEEGRGLFRQRIRAEVREEKDYLVAELVRVAKEKGMQ